MKKFLSKTRQYLVYIEDEDRMDAQRYIDKYNIKGFSAFVRYAIKKLLQNEKTVPKRSN